MNCSMLIGALYYGWAALELLGVPGTGGLTPPHPHCILVTDGSWVAGANIIKNIKMILLLT